MSETENKALIQNLLNELLAAESTQLSSYFATDYVDHSVWRDFEGLIKTITAFRAASPDLKLTLHDMIAEGDKVVVRASVAGTRGGETKTINFIAIYRIAGGKVAEHWAHSDSFF